MGKRRDLKFNGILLLNVTRKRHLNIHVLTAALDGKTNVVGKRKRKVRRQLARNVGARDIGNLRTKLHYLGIDLVKKWQIARINVVKRALNLRKRNLTGAVRKTNAFP